MQPCSAEFQRTVQQSHQIATKVEVIDSSGLPNVLNVALLGQVTIDKTAAVRRSGSVTFVDKDGTLTPRTAHNLLIPYGNYVRMWRGVILPSTGQPELIPLITGRLGKVHIEEPALAGSGSSGSGGLTVTADIYDRSRYIARNKFTNPYVVAAGTNYGDAIKALLQDRDASLIDSRFHFATTPYTTPLLTFMETTGDPWQNAVSMAESCGMELFIDALDQVVMRPEPNVLTRSPAVQLFEGPTCVVTKLMRDIDDTNAYNGVVVIGQSSSIAVPVRGEAWDLNPASPTYSLGRYGKYPTFQTSTLQTTNDQCTAAATALLQSLIGVSERCSIDMIPNPALDTSDVLEVKRVKSGLTDSFQILDSATIHLGADQPMTVLTRERRPAT